MDHANWLVAHRRDADWHSQDASGAAFQTCTRPVVVCRRRLCRLSDCVHVVFHASHCNGNEPECAMGFSGSSDLRHLVCKISHGFEGHATIRLVYDLGSGCLPDLGGYAGLCQLARGSLGASYNSKRHPRSLFWNTGGAWNRRGKQLITGRSSRRAYDVL